MMYIMLFYVILMIITSCGSAPEIIKVAEEISKDSLIIETSLEDFEDHA